LPPIVGLKRPDDRPRFLLAIDDHDWVESAAPKGVVQPDSLKQCSDIAGLDCPADPQRPVL